MYFCLLLMFPLMKFVATADQSDCSSEILQNQVNELLNVLYAKSWKTSNFQQQRKFENVYVIGRTFGFFAR